MRYGLIFAAILGLFGLYGGYWLWLADRAETEAAALQTREQNAGRQLNWENLTITGFPYHIRAEVTAPSWRDDANRTHWETPALTIHGSPTEPSRVIADATQPHHFLVQGRAFSLTSASLFASISNYQAKLPNISIEGEGLALTQPKGVLTLETTKLHFRLSPSQENAIDLAVDFEGIESPVRLGPGLGHKLEKLHSVATIGAMPVHRIEHLLSAPETVMAGWANDNGIATISDLTITLPGGVIISANGRIHAGRAGYPAGTLNAKITGYDVLLAHAVQAGALTLGKAQVTRLGLDLADGMDGAKDGTVSLPLSLSGGAAYLGPVKMADLPKLFPEKPMPVDTPQP
ncbi:MAG: DUF2125 domain-containing protein [Alphaproteobacteria bacterium]